MTKYVNAKVAGKIMARLENPGWQSVLARGNTAGRSRMTDEDFQAKFRMKPALVTYL